MNGNTRPVPGCTSVRACRAALEEAGFEHRTVEIDSARRSGTFLGTSPPRGGRAVPGQVVSILVSNGEDYVQPRPQPDPEPSWERQRQPEAPEPPADSPAPEPEREQAQEAPAQEQGQGPGQDGGGGQDGQGRSDSGRPED
jgi:beta-lactam-binding protein with PASTA domain